MVAATVQTIQPYMAAIQPYGHHEQNLSCWMLLTTVAKQLLTHDPMVKHPLAAGAPCHMMHYCPGWLCIGDWQLHCSGECASGAKVVLMFIGTARTPLLSCLNPFLPHLLWPHHVHRTSSMRCKSVRGPNSTAWSLAWPPSTMPAWRQSQQRRASSLRALPLQLATEPQMRQASRAALAHLRRC